MFEIIYVFGIVSLDEISSLLCFIDPMLFCIFYFHSDFKTELDG